MKALDHRKSRLFLVFILTSFFSLSLLAETFQLGDVAPRGAPDGQLNAADSLILQKMVLGDIEPTNNEIKLGDVAPVGTGDGILNAGDVVVQQRAILGLISLATIDIITLPTPSLNAGASPTSDNPYLISGTASSNATVDIYVNGALQQQAISDAVGDFSISMYLFDGLNNIHAVEVNGANTSLISNVVQVQYNNAIVRNNLPTNISANTVWTAGSAFQPYIISSTITVDENKSLVIQKGATLHFDAGAELIVNGELIIIGTNGLPVYLTSSDSNPTKGIWNGVAVTSTATKVIIDNLIIEYGNACLKFNNSGNVGLVTNSIIRNCTSGIKVENDSSPQIINGNEITLNTKGVEVSGPWNAELDPQPIVMNNKIYSNTSYNYYTKGFGYGFSRTSRLNATQNWWGTNDPNSISALIFDHTDRHDDHYPIVEYGPFKLSESGPLVDANFINGTLIENKTLEDNGKPYYVTGYVEVPEGITLTVLAGVKMKFISTSLDVNGTLAINGSASNKVELTSVNTVPIKGDWNGVNFNSTSVDSVIDHAVISFASTGIGVFGATNMTISNSNIVASKFFGIRFQSGATGLIDSNIISDTDTGIYLSSSSPQIINNEISSSDTGIQAQYSSSVINNNLITANLNYGLLIEKNSTLSITNNAIIFNFGPGIYVVGPYAFPSINNNDIYNNALDSNFLDVVLVLYNTNSGDTLDFTQNWWGTATPDFNTLIADYSYTPSVGVNTSGALLASTIQYSITNVVQSADIVRPAKNEVVNLQFDISKAATVTFSVYERANVAANTAVALYSEQKVVPNTGTYSFDWNGKDAQDNFIKDDAYIYKIFIDSGDWKDNFSPALQAQNFTNMYYPGAAGVDVPANNFYNQRIFFDAPRTVTAILTPDIGAPITLVKNKAYDITDTNIVWDGRRPDGSPLLNTAFTVAFTEDMFATKNVIFVRGARPDITGEDYQTGEAQPYLEVKSDPYLIQHSYDQVSKVSFYVDQDSMVEVKLLPPGIYDPTDSSAKILMSNQPLSAESAPGVPLLHSFIWRGYDDSVATPDTNNILVSQEGLYTFTITATSNATGLSTLHRGSLNLYQ